MRSLILPFGTAYKPTSLSLDSTTKSVVDSEFLEPGSRFDDGSGTTHRNPRLVFRATQQAKTESENGLFCNTVTRTQVIYQQFGRVVFYGKKIPGAPAFVHYETGPLLLNLK